MLNTVFGSERRTVCYIARFGLFFFSFFNLKMIVNPINVINLLLASFQMLNLENTPITQQEIDLKNSIEKILIDAMKEFNDIEIIEDDTLDFQEPYKDVQMQVVEDNEKLWTIDEDLQQCTSDNEELDHDYKARAVEFWRSGITKNLALKTVQNRFRKVRSITQLKRWAHTLNKGGTYREKIARICSFVLENFKAAVESGHIIHDEDLQKWALQAQKEIGHEDCRFKASKHWVNNFKKAHRIVSRKINKFVTKKTLEDAQYLKNTAHNFVIEVKQLIREKGLENTFNSDQSGFSLEIHSGRTLAVEGENQVQCLVQSIASTTHSYTIQPTISADGRLLSPLFLVLKEKDGEFGPIVQQTIFRPDNVYIMASKSGKLTSGTWNFLNFKWCLQIFIVLLQITSKLGSQMYIFLTSVLQVFCSSTLGVDIALKLCKTLNQKIRKLL